VIAVTASVMPHERSTLMSVGFDGFLPKPLAIKGAGPRGARCLGSAAALNDTRGMQPELVERAPPVSPRARRACSSSTTIGAGAKLLADLLAARFDYRIECGA